MSALHSQSSETENAIQDAAVHLNKEHALIIDGISALKSPRQKLVVHSYFDFEKQLSFEIESVPGSHPIATLNSYIATFKETEIEGEKYTENTIAWVAANEQTDSVATYHCIPPLAVILEFIRQFLTRYIAFRNEAQEVAITLWIAHTWAIQAFEYTPYLHIYSPLKRCGKSRLFDCLLALTRKPWAVVSPTEAVLFRKIAADCPTLLLDEVDTLFKSCKDQSKEGLRALLNAGFEKRATVPRCAGKDSLVEHPVYCAKALAGIGKLPDTIADRSLPILLSRRAQNQPVEKFRSREVEPLASAIRFGLETWAQSEGVIAGLRAARPCIPTELGDRAADICEPLIAIADLAQGIWPGLARQALVELCCTAEKEDENTNVKLLNSFREIFRLKKLKTISTHDALVALFEMENEPWADMWAGSFKTGGIRGVASKLANLLKPFGITTGSIRKADGSTPKGYKHESFEDAFSRYLP